MPAWTVSKALLTLRDQLNELYPKRNKSEDGTIGDTRHQQEHSDHNPNTAGVVCALDVTHDPARGCDTYALAEQLRKAKDGRIQYIISNRKIANADIQDWAWRPYRGSDAHDKHIHISIRQSKKFWDDPSKWDLGKSNAKPIAAEPVAEITGPDPDVRKSIQSALSKSPVKSYKWHNRGRAPVGYLLGVLLCYADAAKALSHDDPVAKRIGAPFGAPSQDALAWYGLRDGAPLDNIRQTYALLLGLGMRESSGNYFEGRDTTANNVTSDTAEAGLFQMSWDAHLAAPDLFGAILDYYSVPAVDGYLDIFSQGLPNKTTPNFGSGVGVTFQQLAKTKPAFAVECAALGLRVIRKHWGPINRKEAEYDDDVEALLQDVQDQVIKGS